MAKIDKLTYVDQAEKVIKSMREKNRNGGYRISLTTSKIRNILSLVTAIYNQVIHDPNPELSEDICQEIQYLRLRIIYEAGRDDKDKDVMKFVKKAELIENIQSIGKSREQFLLFCRYMEALVAYHRFYGGRDA
ncbi:type III-A CRISPR-associated protein Csm2 [Anaerostipes butyraticus]|uniref:CRISPR system Cms protein Csm2 n=1 Tax=Anaerostipes butyraticus TaxID=645466 RepID=A0A916VD28_9FIRM|nr:type III-A CRISPR-associated protein Csm2 [Anaerostipes butyraticus]GFO85360.1 type III-A CRISPR-associated protein Csm2 [Anaerostipes butyraticus]HJC81810.1 type III-A CRISPR-associated protein Csm2 [Candidatus Anaerostipes avicola]